MSCVPWRLDLSSDSPWRDVGAGRAGKGAAEIGRVGDDCAALTASFKKGGDGLYLGPHAAARELPLRQVALRFGQRKAIQV